MSLVTNVQNLVTAIADQFKVAIVAASSNLGTTFRTNVVFTSAGATTQTLPLAVAGKQLTLTNNGTGLVTVTSAGADNIAGTISRLLFPTQSVTLFCSATGIWGIGHTSNRFRSVAPANVANSTIAMADATGVSFTAFANVTYKFRVELGYNSAALATGVRVSMNGPASSLIRYYFENTLTTNTIIQNYYTAYNTVTTGNPASLLTGNVALGYGVLTPAVNGTIVARFASEIAASAITVLSGQSFIEWTPMGTSIVNTGVF